MLGSLAMSMSSLCVVTNALRLRFFKSKFAFSYNEKSEEKGIIKIKEKEDVTMTKTIFVDGMMCNHCKAHVEKALATVSGVEKIQVNLEEKCAVIEGDAKREDCIKAITDAGYDVKD